MQTAAATATTALEQRVSDAQAKERERLDRERQIRALKQEKLKQLFGVKTAEGEGESTTARAAAAGKTAVPSNFASDGTTTTVRESRFTVSVIEKRWAAQWWRTIMLMSMLRWCPVVAIDG